MAAVQSPGIASRPVEGSRALASPVRPEGLARPGLRLRRSGGLALRRAYFNGGSPIAVPGGAGGSGGRISMRVASKGAYICRDCGYIYNDRRSFESLPSDYSCPVCAAPKRRFKPYDGQVSRNANDQTVRKARKADLKQAGSGLGSALPIGIAVGVAALLGVYIYTSTAF